MFGTALQKEDIDLRSIPLTFVVCLVPITQLQCNKLVSMLLILNTLAYRTYYSPFGRRIAAPLIFYSSLDKLTTSLPIYPNFLSRIDINSAGALFPIFLPCLPFDFGCPVFGLISSTSERFCCSL